MSGSDADLQSPDYHYLKAHRKLLRSVNPDCRFIYLTGLKDDGAVVFLVDSEAPGSKYYSPPGQIYPEAAETIRQVFATGVESVAGPASDRWGFWVSALVPLPAAKGVQPLAVLGTDIDAGQWAWGIFKNCLPAIAMTLLGLSGLAFLFVFLRRSDQARRRIAASGARLAESEERYRIAAENTGQVIYDYHVPSGEIRWSGAIKEKPAIERGRPLDRLQGSGETILVVDDIRQQREIASAILIQLGYAVRTAASGEEAVDHMKDQCADLLVLDMIMESGIDGLETYRRILCHRPGQRAIITSGYSETERVSDALQLGAGQYLKKPYTIENLGMAVKEELRRS